MLFRQVKRTIDRYHLLSQGDRLIVGVSGGVDSMVLLHLLNTYRPTLDLVLVVAHVNHGLRPDESEKEFEQVRTEANRLGLPFEYGQFDVKAFGRQRGLSLQDAGRRIRFHFFKGLLTKYHAQKIALGQNADDQVETVLLRLIRGTGLRGLRGMLPVREGIVIRPLLETWREEIESFAQEHGIPYLVDSSNLRENYLRNRLRLKLIPLIEREYQPNLKKRVLKTSALLREEDDFVDKGAEKAYEKMVREEKNHLSFQFSEYQELHTAVKWRFLRRLLEKALSHEITEGEELPDVDQIHRRLNRPPSSFHVELTHNLFLEKRYDTVLLRRGKAEPVTSFEVELMAPGRTRIEEIGNEILVEEIPGDDKIQKPMASPNTASFDYEELQFPLRMRSFRPGDRFQPLGVRGTQRVKEFFIDHKIPRFEREKIPLLVSGERIIWVVGYRIDDRVKITEKTRRILKVEVKEISD